MMIIMRESQRKRERERERERDDVYLLKGERKREGYIRRTDDGKQIITLHFSALRPSVRPRGLIVPARAGGSREARHGRQIAR